MFSRHQVVSATVLVPGVSLLEMYSNAGIQEKKLQLITYEYIVEHGMDMEKIPNHIMLLVLLPAMSLHWQGGVVSFRQFGWHIDHLIHGASPPQAYSVQLPCQSQQQAFAAKPAPSNSPSQHVPFSFHSALGG
jgi:hypothetical protein